MPIANLDSFCQNIITRDLRDLFVGPLIGSGTFRVVYGGKHDETAVIKFELDGWCFQNVMEHEVWQEVRGTEHAKWFAPVLDISPCGSILIQRRTRPLRPEELPDKMPNYFTDLKMKNFGLLGKRIVCHDYGITNLMRVGMTRRMCKADWWETETAP